jgi:hypothetical protein
MRTELSFPDCSVKEREPKRYEDTKQKVPISNIVMHGNFDLHHDPISPCDNPSKLLEEVCLVDMGHIGRVLYKGRNVLEVQSSVSL